MSQSPPNPDGPLFGPVNAVRTSERVAEAIQRTIAEGKLKPGATLPPERTLAERFRVTRNTVREALRMLEQHRLVTVRQGSGVRVMDYLANAGLEFMAVLLEAPVRGRPALFADLLEAREVLGKAMCMHAVDHIGPEAVAQVEEAVQVFEHAVAGKNPDVRRLQQLDFEIHNRLVRGGGNRAFILLHNSLGQVYERVAHLFESVVARPEKVAALHRKLVNALARNDRTAARKVVTAMFAGETGNKKQRNGK